MLKKISALLLAILLIAIVAVFSATVNRTNILRAHLGLPDFSHGPGAKSEFMLPMRDGIRLRTLRMFPDSEGPWPTVLIRNPYDTMGSDFFNWFCELFVRYGYACVYQETRGQMRSEGEWEPLVNEIADGSDTLHWIAGQNWNDGNIGMWGVSYLALTQWAGAMDHPRALKTFVPISMGTDFHSILYEKGNMRLFVSLWALLMPDRNINIEGVLKFMEAAEHRPHTEIDQKYAGKTLDWYQEWIRDVGTDAPTWQREDAKAVKKVGENLHIPVLIYEGWYDPFFKAELQNFQSLASRSQSRMVLGPWSHIQLPASSRELIAEPAIGLSLTDTLVWFERYLKGVEESEVKEGVRVFDIGLDKWKEYYSWPNEGAYLHFALANFDQANTCEGGRLVRVPQAEDIFEQEHSLSPMESVSYTYDPDDPVMSRGGSAFLGPLDLNIAPGSIDQKGLCDRDDVLTFVSEPFEKHQTISGTQWANLLVSTDAEDTAFTAKLIDVSPDGLAVNIRDSISTLAYRNNASSALTYTPNDRVAVSMDMWPIEWTIKKGHRLRLDISSSNFPAFNIHSNFSGPWSEQAKVKKAEQTVYKSSNLIIPIFLGSDWSVEDWSDSGNIQDSSSSSLNHDPDQPAY